MAKNVVIRDVQYENVPSVNIPLASGQGNAEFVDTSDANLASASHLPAGKSAYANGVKYNGTAAQNDSDDLTVAGATVTAPAGFYEATASKTIPSGSASPQPSMSATDSTLTPGTNKITLTKTIQATPQVSAGYVAAGTSGNVNVSLEASVTVKGAETITPGTSAQTISADTYLTGVQTIEGDSNLTGSNIVYGKSIFGIDGQVKVPVVSQDSTTKVLSIS